MNTPICDFVKKYIDEDNVRLHMPGHKGRSMMAGILDDTAHNMELFDITEIDGADELYDAHGIIAESESNASHLFGCPTFYSTEGSSHVIRSMLWLVKNTMTSGDYILAGRNAHKTFSLTTALLDIPVKWIMPYENENYQSCTINATDIERILGGLESKPKALYITSPDYLGHVADIKGIAKVCHSFNILLLVDNAHGAYLRFLPESQHPMDLGADMCCDSAHKTLPVLTGGAYLHISAEYLNTNKADVKMAMSVFGSTSPSYLILQSLDKANAYMDNLPKLLSDFTVRMAEIKSRISELGYRDISQEIPKITLKLRTGYGQKLAEYLYENRIIPEHHDDEYIVFMVSPHNEKQDIEKLIAILEKWEYKETATDAEDEIKADKGAKCSVRLSAPEQAMSGYAAMFSEKEELPLAECSKRVLAVATTGCPPAVPIFTCGERIEPGYFEVCSAEHIPDRLWVVKENT